MRYLTLVFALLLSSLSALAADVAGTWALTIESPNGPLDVTLTLKQDGDKLTGIVSSQMGEAPITGTVKDSAVEFTMNFDANGAAMVLLYKGKIDTDGKIAGTIDLGGQGEMKFSGAKKS
jgi:hypothetical protein